MDKYDHNLPKWYNVGIYKVCVCTPLFLFQEKVYLDFCPLLFSAFMLFSQFFSHNSILLPCTTAHIADTASPLITDLET